MSLRALERDDLRKLRPCGNDDLAIRSDVGRRQPLIDRKGGMRTESARTLAADAHGEIRALLDVLRPRVGVHRQPLGGDRVEDEEEETDGRKDREEARRLPLHGSAPDVLQAALDEGPAAIVREEAKRAKPGLDTTPQDPF